uniref:Uncharacterized protein n=1 Tax=Arundo donax TaxID=35708 RepID=A0A0A9BJR9_ARUDO
MHAIVLLIFLKEAPLYQLNKTITSCIFQFLSLVHDKAKCNPHPY